MEQLTISHPVSAVKWVFATITRSTRWRVASAAVELFAGNILQAVSTLMAVIIVARSVGSSEFGVFALAFAVLSTATAFADLGLNTGMIRFASAAIAAQRWGEARAILRLNLRWRLGAGGVFAITGVITAPTLTRVIWHDPSFTPAVQLAIGGSFAVVLMSYGIAAHISVQRFRDTLVALALSGMMRLLGIVGMTWVGALTPATATAAMALGPALAAAWLFRHQVLPHTPENADLPAIGHELLQFSRWVAVSAILVALRLRADVLLTARFARPAVVGHYSAAQQLAFALPLLTGAVTTALLPHVSALEGLPEIRRYVGRVLRLAPLAALIAVGGATIAPGLIPLLFGSRFVPAVPSFQVLIIAYSISLVINPLGLVLFWANRPQLLTAVNAVQLVFVAAACPILIPRYGALGAGLAVLASQIASASVIAALSLRSLTSVTHVPRRS